MQLFIQEMNEKFAVDILNWKYEAPYDFYNNDLNSEAIREMLENSYNVVLDQNDELVGFLCYGKSAQVSIGAQFGAYDVDSIDIGIGMNPKLTGQGNGKGFFSFVLQYIQATFPRFSIRLSVAAFNKRAIRLYENLGFKKQVEFNRNEVEFMTMVLE